MIKCFRPSEYMPVSRVIKYDKIVDRSKFISDNETVRNALLSPSSAGSNGVPVYDDDSNPPSDFEVRLRSGKVDKGEVFQRQLSLQDEIKDSDTKAKAKKAKAKQDKIEAARQAHLDAQTGFVPPAESSDA